MAENVFAVTQSEIGQAASSEIVERRKFIESHRAIPINAPLGAEDEQLEYVSCGRSIGGTQFKVIGEDGVRCPERHVGEICVHGNSLFSGYFRRDDLTEQAFTPDGWYKTGDLGYEANDELYITGRKKDLIIVQGRNFYPHDIEAAAAEAPNIIPGRIVAFGVEDESLGTESIVVLAETDPFPPPDTAALALEIRKRVAQVLDCTLKDVRFVEPRWLVKSTSGKNAREDNKQKYYSQILQAGADHGSRNV
jgi:acyl-CoA synthetase (AMP-forming)/AMP-acid ligase II